MPRSGQIVASDFRPKFDNRLGCLEAEKNQQGQGGKLDGFNRSEVVVLLESQAGNRARCYRLALT
jgi:hypothetical protein